MSGNTNGQRFLDYAGVEKLLNLIRQQMIEAGHEPPDIITDPTEVGPNATGLPTGGVLYAYTTSAIGGALATAIGVNGSIYTFVTSTISDGIAENGNIWNAIKAQVDAVQVPQISVITDQELEDLINSIFGT